MFSYTNRYFSTEDYDRQMRKQARVMLIAFNGIATKIIEQTQKVGLFPDN